MSSCTVCAALPAKHCPKCRALLCEKCFGTHYHRLHERPQPELDPSAEALAYQERRDQELKDESHER